VKHSSQLRRRLTPLALMLVGLVLLSGCTALVLPEGWAGLTVDGVLNEDGRYEGARYVYVAYRDVVFRIDTQTAPEGRPTERLVDWAAHAGGQMFAAPAVSEEGTVYVGAYNHFLYAFSPYVEPRTGPMTTFNAPAANDRIVADAVVRDGLVYVGQGDRGIRAYDAQSGALRASYENTRFGIWSAPVFDDATNTLYVGSMDHNVYALDARTLSYVWEINVGGAVAAPPLLHDGMLYVGTFGNEMLAIDATLNPPRIVSRFPTDGWVWSTPVLRDGTLYFGDLGGNVYAIDAQTFQVRWRTRNEAYPGAVRGRVAVVDGIVVAAFESRYLQAYEQATGRVLWTSSPATEDRILSDVVVIDNTVLYTTLSENQLVIAHDLQTGGRLWSVRKPNQDDFARLTLTPAQQR
jgi:outer membrane protein assembly factor BamB